MRTIREADQFQARLKELNIPTEKMDELLESIVLTVARRPEIFEQIPGKPLRRFRVVPFPGMPRMNVWFTYDDQYVDLLEIDVLEADGKYEL